MADFNGLAAALNRDGWLVIDCHQSAPTRWYVTLRRNDHSRAYGMGETASAALFKATQMIPKKRKRVALIR